MSSIVVVSSVFVVPKEGFNKYRLSASVLDKFNGGCMMLYLKPWTRISGLCLVFEIGFLEKLILVFQKPCPSAFTGCTGFYKISLLLCSQSFPRLGSNM